MDCCKSHRVADPCKNIRSLLFYKQFNTEHIPGAVMMMAKVQELLSYGFLQKFNLKIGSMLTSIELFL